MFGNPNNWVLYLCSGLFKVYEHFFQTNFQNSLIGVVRTEFKLSATSFGRSCQLQLVLWEEIVLMEEEE